MYGIVNKAIEDLVKENFGEAKWELIKKRSGIEEDFFISNEPYDDSITFLLAHAASQELQVSVDTILVTFGEWWVLRTSKEKYGRLMEAGGANLEEFLLNLPMFHNRIMLLYPQLTPPEFKVIPQGNRNFQILYFSKRHGLQEFVRGLLQGLGKLYGAQVVVELLGSRAEGAAYETFKISW